MHEGQLIADSKFLSRVYSPSSTSAALLREEAGGMMYEWMSYALLSGLQCLFSDLV